MCGFLVEFSETIDVNKWRNSFNLISNRGPDYSGEHIEKNEAWGHHRLSIIDLSSDGNQPLISNSSKLVFNGEIYNYEELGIHYLGSKYKSDSKFLFDYLNNGYRDFNVFKGFWSFVYKSPNNDIIVCRDKFGIKPLYYLARGKNKIFCSEIKSLIPYLDSVSVNNDLIDEYLLNGGVDGYSETLIKSIHQVLPGTYQLNNSEIRYFDINSSDCKSTVSWENLLSKSIIHSTVSDVPLAISLSSGVDSNIINSYVSGLNAFTSGKTKRGLIDEYTVVESVCNAKNQKLKIIEIKESFSFNELKKSLYIVDFPSWNLNPIFYNSYYSEVRKSGYKLILEGHGVDEYLGGYQKHIYDFLYDALIKLDLKAARKIYNTMVSTNNESYNNKRWPFWLYSLKIIANFIGIDNYSDTEKRIDLIRGNYKIIPLKFITPFVTNRSRKNRILDVTLKIIPTVLRVFDRVTMNNGIEMRPPLLDDELISKGLNGTYKELVSENGQKVPFRKVLKKRDYPKIIIQQKKKYGFSADLHFLLLTASECLNEDYKIYFDKLKINYSKVRKMYNEYYISKDWQKGETLSRVFSIVIWYSNIYKQN